jgi:outer membrane protein assembly factor BamB
MRTCTLPALVAPILITTTAFAADWPQWRGPDRTDVSKEKGLLREWPKGGPKLLWTFRDAGLGFSGFAVVGDRLYTMGAENSKEYVFAVDLKTQKKVWSTEVGPMYTEGHGDGPRCTPTVDGEVLYALGAKGNLVCVNVATGAKVWEKTLQSLGGGQPGWGYTESPLVDGDKVVVTPGGSKGTIGALDKKTGELIWQSKDFKDGAQYSSLIAAEFNGTRQYIQLTQKSVAGVAAADGQLLWQVARPGKTAVITTPVYADGLVFVTSGYGVGCDLVKLAADGAQIKAAMAYSQNHDIENQHGGVLKVGDYLYGHSDKLGWVCQEFKTGKKMWGEKKLGKGSVTCADGHLYCYSEDKGEVALVEAMPEGWKEMGRFTIPEKSMLPYKGRIWTHPVVANGKLYLRHQDLIFCYDVSDGKSS